MPKPETPTQFFIRHLLPKPYSRQVRDWYRHKTSDMVVVSAPKSGRTWLRVMISGYYTKVFELPELEIIGFENLHRKNPEIPKIFFTHDDALDLCPEELQRDKSKYRKDRLIFLARDPRDVIVSLYFQRTKRALDLQKDTKIADFVFGRAGGLATMIEFYNIWAGYLLSYPEALLIRYEDMQADATTVVSGVLEHANTVVDHTILEEVVAESSFEQMKKKERDGHFDLQMLRPRDVDDDDSYKVRRGKVGGYRDYFSADHLQAMDRLVTERLAPVFRYQG